MSYVLEHVLQQDHSCTFEVKFASLNSFPRLERCSTLIVSGLDLLKLTFSETVYRLVVSSLDIRRTKVEKHYAFD